MLADRIVLELSHRAATDSTATCEVSGPAARGKDGCFWVPGPAGVTLELLLVGFGVRSQDHFRSIRSAVGRCDKRAMGGCGSSEVLW